MILDEVKEKFIKGIMREEGKRADGRAFDEYRGISIDTAVFPNAEGGAWVKLGDTQVAAGVKIDLATPYSDRPDEGMLIFNAEFSPLAHPDFTPGRPGENSIELARVVDRGIRSAESIDVKKLFVEEGKVLGVFVDLYIIDHSGNLIDASALAAMAALNTARLPKIEDGAVVYGEYSGKLDVGRSVVTTTFEKIEDQIILDANDHEEVASEARFTLGTGDGDKFASAQKSGNGGFTRKEFEYLLDASLEKGGELRKLVKVD
jgi:exosome complex component RRP42